MRSAPPTTRWCSCVKVDWQLGANHLLTIRDNYSTQEGENLTADYPNTGRSNNGLEENSFNSFVATLNSVISDTVFNEAYLQWSQEERPRSANNTTIPEAGIYPYLATWGQNQFLPNFLDEDRIQLIDNVTFYAGNHTLKFGANLDFVSFNDGFFRYGTGVYSYNEWEGRRRPGLPRRRHAVLVHPGLLRQRRRREVRQQLLRPLLPG